MKLLIKSLLFAVVLLPSSILGQGINILQLDRPVKKVGELFPTIVHIGTTADPNINVQALDIWSNGFIGPFNQVLSVVRQGPDGTLHRTTFNAATGKSSYSYIVEGITITNRMVSPTEGLFEVPITPIILPENQLLPIPGNMEEYFLGEQNEIQDPLRDLHTDIFLNGKLRKH